MTSHTADNMHDAIIIGGGIAGIAAALKLVEHGVQPVLLETRKKLGGRATSFDDVRTGQTIDNCQHVVLGCCTNFTKLLDQLDALQHIDWQRTIYWYEAGGRVSAMSPAPLPAPAHYGPALLGAKFLTAKEKLSVALAMQALLHTDRQQLPTDLTFGQWLAKRNTPKSLIETFWEPVIVSACNLLCDKVSARCACHVFQEGFLAHNHSASMGVAKVPLRDLYDNAHAMIQQAGGEVRLGASVKSVRMNADSSGVISLSNSEELRAQRVICTVPPERVIKIVDEQTQQIDPRFEGLSRITHSPILGVHLTFDRPVLPTKNAVLVARPTQWLFRKDDKGAAVHAVISAADDWRSLSEEQITQRVRTDIVACMPGASDAQVVSSRPVMEKFATFAPVPGVDELRPTTTGLSGLILAGTYVQTGWPCTMEGATRSGWQAAAAALGQDEQAFVQPPLKPSWPVRLVGAKGLRDQHKPQERAKAKPTVQAMHSKT